MKDNELIAFLKVIIDAGLTANNIGAQLTQSYQPVAEGQGPNNNIQVFMEILSDHEYGWVGRDDSWDSVNQQFVHTEQQMVETTFQVGCMSIQNPADTTQLTSKDILKIVAGTLRSDPTITAMKNAGLGILRITEVRNPKFRDDRDQWQASPSFDFTVVHKQSTILTVPKADPVQVGIIPV